MPDQGRHALMPRGENLADEQHVIAGGVQRVVPAFEPRGTAVDQRRVCLPQAKRDARETVGMRA